MPGEDRTLKPQLPSRLDWHYLGDGEWVAESDKDVYTIRLIEGQFHLYVVKDKRLTDLMTT